MAELTLQEIRDLNPNPVLTGNDLVFLYRPLDGTPIAATLDEIKNYVNAVGQPTSITTTAAFSASSGFGFIPSADGKLDLFIATVGSNSQYSRVGNGEILIQENAKKANVSAKVTLNAAGSIRLIKNEDYENPLITVATTNNVASFTLTGLDVTGGDRFSLSKDGEQYIDTNPANTYFSVEITEIIA